MFIENCCRMQRLINATPCINLQNKDILFHSQIDDTEQNLIYNAMCNKNTYAIIYLLGFIQNKKQAQKNHLYNIMRLSIKISSYAISALLIEKLIALDSLDCSIDDIMLDAFTYANNNKIVRFLLLKGASPHLIDSNGHSVMHNLILSGNDELLELFIDHYDVNVNILDSNGINVIFKVIDDDNSKTSAILLVNGTDLYCKDLNGLYLIQRCVRKKWYLHVHYILCIGFTLLYDDEQLFHSVCHDAVSSNSNLIFDLLLSHYFACKIQRHWRRTNNNKKLCIPKN